MKVYIEYFKEFITDKKFIIPIIIIALLSFGFVITHYSISWDSLSLDRYFKEAEALQQQRFSSVILENIFHILKFLPFNVDFLAVCILIIASILYCTLFKKVSNNKINNIAYVIFAGFFISYPLINEIFICTTCNLTICLGYALIGMALIIAYESLNKKKELYMYIVAIIICFSVALYESFATVYLFGVFAILIIEMIYIQKEEKYILKAFQLLMPLALGVLLKLLIGNIIVKVLENLNYTQLAGTGQVIYYKYYGIINGLNVLITSIFYKFFICGFYYLPITFFQIALITSFIFEIKYYIQLKNKNILLLFTGLQISTISLSIIMGMAAPYRTCQTFALFVAFVFMILINEIYNSGIKKYIKNIILIVLCIMIFYQTTSLSTLFYANNLRYEEENNVVNMIGNELTLHYDLNKPVIFIGGYKLSDNVKQYAYLKTNSTSAKIAKSIMDLVGITDNYFYDDGKYVCRYVEFNILPYLTWSVTAFKQMNTETLKLFAYNGYEFKLGTKEMINQAYSIINDNNKNEIIIDTSEFIIINLSNI